MASEGSATNAFRLRATARRDLDRAVRRGDPPSAPRDGPLVEPGLSSRLSVEWMGALICSVQREMRSTSPGLIVFGSVVSIWEVSGAVRAVMGALNRIFGVDERRNLRTAEGTLALVLSTVGYLYASAIAFLVGAQLDQLLRGGRHPVGDRRQAVRPEPVTEPLPTLYQAEWCPYSSAVREVLTELGIDVVLRQVEPSPERRAHLRELAGTDEIPVLVTEDGTVFRGTRAIFDHLRERRGGEFARAHRHQYADHRDARESGATGRLLERFRGSADLEADS